MKTPTKKKATTDSGVMKYVKLVTGSRAGSLVCNIALAYAVMMVARLLFAVANIGLLADGMSWQLAGRMLQGALMFDTAAIIYTNALYVLLVLLPLHKKETPVYATIMKWVWIVSNSIALAANLADCARFECANHRTTASELVELCSSDNAPVSIITGVLSNWFLVIIFGAIVWGMWKLYRKPTNPRPKNLKAYYAVQTTALAALTVLCVAGTRGGFALDSRPIGIGNASLYVNRQAETGIVLNTPFSLIRTIGKKPFATPDYMSDYEMEATYTPLHYPKRGKRFTRRNVVVIIAESCGSEYSGMLNSDLDGGSYRGFTPFLDSLMSRGTTFRYSFGNGRSNIDAIASVLTGIPMMEEPFFLSQASLNDVTGIAGELRKEGYHTAFFRGAPGNTACFKAYSRTMGFEEYYGADEYLLHHPDAGNSIDATGAVCDEPFLQYCCERINRIKEPFVASVYTASLHKPFNVPAQYETTLPDGKMPIHKCAGYTDLALRRFFEAAQREKWYGNTLFVVTADHTNQSCRNVYATDLGVYAVPIVLYAPGDTTLRRGVDDRPIAQQTDIMPTVLGYLGYNSPYIAFGCDLLHTPANETFAVNYHNGIYQYVKGEYLLQFDGTRTTGFYRFKSDRLLQVNLVRKSRRWQPMESELKALIRQYKQRMEHNNLTTKSNHQDKNQ